MVKEFYFISDLHLGLQAPEIEKLKEKSFENFLHAINGKAEKLFILGDLFDYWFEYRRVYQKGYFRTFTALQDLANSGTEIHYLIGNHDFLHRDFFEKDLNIRVYQGDLEVELEGKKFFLSHGDGKVNNDYGYRVLKVILRNKFLQKLYSLLHPDFGIWLASSTSKKSRDYTATKDYGEIDGLFEEARKCIDKGFDFVIMGHTHAKAIENYNTGVYANLGSWLNNPCFGIFRDGKFEIIDWK